MRPPRVRVITLFTCNCIYCMGGVQYRTLSCIADSSVTISLICSFCWSVREFASSFLQIPHCNEQPLPFANNSYCQAWNGLSPPSYQSCQLTTSISGISSSHWL